MLPRFWVAAPLIPGRFDLSDMEGHHLRNVLRLSTGAVVELFDGAGRSAAATVVKVDKRQVVVEVADVQETPSTLPTITIATAVPKGERLDWLIEKGTELDVSTIVPLRTERSTVDPREGKLDRLRQVVIAACKQSRRDHAMSITAICEWSEFVRSDYVSQRWVVAHPGGVPLGDWIFEQQRSASAPLALCAAVGPEGGWTDAEVAAAIAAGAVPVSLGPQILRIETAVILLAAAFQTCLGAGANLTRR